MATATFFVYGGTALWHAIDGASSCGCFGAIEVDPWFVIALDASLFALLLLSAWEHHPSALSRRPRRPLAAGTFVLLLVLWIAIGAPLPGLFRNAWFRFQGYCVVPQEFFLILRREGDTQRRTTTIALENLTDWNVDVIGYRASRSNVKISPVPAEVCRQAKLQVIVDDLAPGSVTERLDLYTDRGRDPIPLFLVYPGKA